MSDWNSMLIKTLRDNAGEVPEGQALRHWAPVHVHLGSAHVMGRVALLEADRLEPGQAALAQLVLEEKVGTLAGDRIILRDPSAVRTIAGAEVIDPFGPPRNRRTARRLAELAALGAGDDEVLGRVLRLEQGFVDVEHDGRRQVLEVVLLLHRRRRPALVSQRLV